MLTLIHAIFVVAMMVVVLLLLLWAQAYVTDLLAPGCIPDEFGRCP